MIEAVSIIHGAKFPYETMSRTRLWMASLADHLRAQGFHPVERYEWSGGYIRSFTSRVHCAYADHLVDLFEKASSLGGVTQLHIFAKSNGAFIAERSLRYLSLRGYEIPIGVFLSVATADARDRIDIPGVQRVIRLSSNSDSLYACGMVLSRLTLAWKKRFDQRLVEHYKLDGLSHHDFNHHLRIRLVGEFEGEIYELYSRLLRGSTYRAAKAGKNVAKGGQ